MLLLNVAVNTTTNVFLFVVQNKTNQKDVSRATCPEGKISMKPNAIYGIRATKGQEINLSEVKTPTEYDYVN